MKEPLISLPPEYKGLELSTQLLIRGAMDRGYLVELLDRKENVIRIQGKKRYELVQQATRTRKDSYISPLIMGNKALTKLLLAEAGISVPAGEVHNSMDSLQEAYPRWKNSAFVLKPNSTNFGTAVFLFPQGTGPEAFQEAGKKAFSEDSTVLLEKMATGKEYRFLIIGEEVRAVLHRIPANVRGDGISSIAHLVNQKNMDPLRGHGYVSPMEKIRRGEEETLYLKQQGLTWDNVPEPGQQIFLRENSNISTGGDGIDYTDSIHPGYKDIALAATRVLGAQIAGADIMIDDIQAEPGGDNYSLIEMNYNPALHIHDYPAVGKNRHVERYVLDLLGLR